MVGKKEGMVTVIDNDLTLTPMRGKSNKAYMGTYPSGERVFVKKNTTPILAALAKEQIAPQLLWAKRLGNGDMMSAQEWLDGRILLKQDMMSKQIVQVLLRLHKSKHLANQLLQLKYQIENPYELLAKLEREMPLQLRENTFIQSIVKGLKQSLPNFNRDDATIVHGDVRHNNWIITTSGVIYLVDWDSVRLTDPMYDIGHLLSHYVPRVAWSDWLVYYGYDNPKAVMDKVYWYGQLSYLSQIQQYFDNRDMERVNREIYALRKFRELFK